MKIRVLGLILISLLAVLSVGGCSREDGEAPEGSVRIYCTDAAMTELKWEYYTPKGTTVNDLIDEYIGRLVAKPSNDLFRKAKPDNVVIKNWYFGTDGQLILDFSSSYSEMDNITEVFCRAGIVKTLGQIEDVRYIEFYIEGEPLASKTGILTGLMKADDFIDNTGEYVQFRQKTQMTVYFASATSQKLEAQEFIVENDGTNTLEQIAMKLLFRGPDTEAGEDILPVIPASTKLNEISVHDGTCYIDMSREFVYGCGNVTDELSVYAIVNTLVELPGITSVQISIEGQATRMIGGFNLQGTLERRPELIAVENAVD